jgi:hypothetical protein
MNDYIPKDFDYAGAYYKTMLAKHWMNELIGPKIFENEDDELNRKLTKLNIMEKKRMLGIPLTDDDYEKSVNENKSFAQRPMNIAAITTKTFAQNLTSKPLPDLRFFEKPTSISSGNMPKASDFYPWLKYFEKERQAKIPKMNLAELLKMAVRKKL